MKKKSSKKKSSERKKVPKKKISRKPSVRKTVNKEKVQKKKKATATTKKKTSVKEKQKKSKTKKKPTAQKRIKKKPKAKKHVKKKISKKSKKKLTSRKQKEKKEESVQAAIAKREADRRKQLKLHDEEDTSERARGLTPMRIYLNQIEHIPLLKPVEELDLSRLIQERLDGWKDARKRMIRSNLRLVINIAKRYMKLGLQFSDLVEEGNIGLMRAVDKFNYKKGYRFSTYASWWIKQSIMRALSNQGKLIRIPVHMFETMSRWRKVREYLMQKTGRMPTHKDIAKIMKIKPEKVKEIESVASTAPSSLNAPVSIEGDAELMDLIEDDNQRQPHEEVHTMSKNERIETLLNIVNEREKKILILRFGLSNHDTHTLEETAQQFGITRERVRQIEEAALKKIRARLEEENDKLENYL